MFGCSGSSLNEEIYYESSGYGLEADLGCDFEGLFEGFG